MLKDLSWIAGPPTIQKQVSANIRRKFGLPEEKEEMPPDEIIGKPIERNGKNDNKR
jgi:hypothetical protein